MASLLDKVQTLISANLHYLVDQALKQNSIAVINQYIREVEDNLEDLSEATATVGGQVKTLRRKQEEYQARAADLDRNIDRFLQEGREDLARAAQSKLNSTQRLVDTYTQQLEQMEREYQSLRDARLKLEAKLTTIKQERETSRSSARTGEIQRDHRQGDQIAGRSLGRGRRRCGPYRGLHPGAPRPRFRRKRDARGQPGSTDGRGPGSLRVGRPTGGPQGPVGIEQQRRLSSNPVEQER